MRLRLATLDDREKIARLHCESWVAAFSKINPDLVKSRGDQFPRRYEAWGNFLKDEALFTYLAEDENQELLGFGQGGQVRDELELPDYDGELVRLYVSPSAQKQGIGKKLIHQVARTLRERGNTSMIVVAWKINSPARRIYEHLGAQFIKEIKQERDGFDNSQSVYGWTDINTVIKATAT